MPYLEVRVLSSLKVKYEKWKTCIDKDPGRRIIIDFLERPDSRRIVLWDGGKDLCVDWTMPPGLKKKVVYFLKRRPVLIDASNYKNEIVCGELAPNVLETTLSVCQDVYMPLLGSARNQDSWSETLAKEVMDHMQRFMGSTYVTVGQTRGMTLLPLPPPDMNVGSNTMDRATRDKERVHTLESYVVIWTRLIKAVLRTEPEGAMQQGPPGAAAPKPGAPAAAAAAAAPAASPAPSPREGEDGGAAAAGPQGGESPGALAEVDFWTAKAANLDSIDQQLSGSKIRKVAKILDMTKSTYYPTFAKLCKEVAQARTEATDNANYLRRLKRHFVLLHECGDFMQLPNHFWPVMHLLALVWRYSTYYNTSSRLNVLLRLICNDVIEKATGYVNPQEIFHVEPAEAVDRVRLAIRVCQALKDCYDEYREKVAVMVPNNLWRVPHAAVFSRLESFVERCHDILDLAQTTVQFAKLEKLEIGGTKGRSLSQSVRQIFTDFTTAYSAFQAVKYSPVDCEGPGKAFEEDFYKFRGVVRELERRLGSVLAQAFDDCTTVEGCFKLIDSFEGLLEREALAADLEKKYPTLIHAYTGELKMIAEEFARHKEDPPMATNLPPVAGALLWCQGLKERAELMDRFKAAAPQSYARASWEGEDGRELQKVHERLVADLAGFMREQYAEWEKGVEDVSQEKLKQSLLRKGKGKDLLVNFNPALVKLLREVKYFQLLKLDIPDSAMQIFKKAEVFRTQIGNLDLITQTFNTMMATMLDVEYPLVAKQLDTVSKLLEKGQKNLNWKSLGIGDFISEAMTKVKGAHQLLTTLKSDVKDVEKVLESWWNEPLLKRKEDKTYTLDDFTVEQQHLYDTRSALVIEGGQDIHKFLLNSNKVLKVPKGSPPWKAYVDYVNEIVVQGIARTVANSLGYLKRQMDPVLLGKGDINPLLEIKLELVPPDVTFSPPLGSRPHGDGLRDVIQKWTSGFFNIASLVRRLDTGEGDYVQEITEHEGLLGALNEIVEYVEDNEAKCADFRRTFEAYSYLWKDDMQAKFEEFLRAKTPEGKRIPPLAEFDAEIARYRPLAEAIQNLPSTSTIGWLRVDAKPVKQALGAWVARWSNLYVSYLSNHVVSSVQNFLALLERVNEGLGKDAEPGDVLLELMGYLRDVRVRTEEYDEMFEPLRQTVALLRKYDTHLPEQILHALDDAPVMWNNTKKLTYHVKEQLQPLQNAEAELLKQRGKGFEQKVGAFRALFQQKAPFGYSEAWEEAYGSLDSYQAQLVQLEEEAGRLNELQELFELHVAQYKELKETRGDIVLLKSVWDVIALQALLFQSWKQTGWEHIDVDFLIAECNKLLKEVRALDKALKNWEAFRGLEDAVKNLITSLPLVQELHDPAMRDRHWKQLMRATGVTIHLDETFTLASMLALKLHEQVDAVMDIVDCARKELIIENNLKKIDGAWRNLKLEFVQYEESETLILQTPEQIMEALEEHLVQVQNMIAGKYVQGNPQFSEEVNKWLVRLGSVESVLNVWLEVQSKWVSLEAIFVGSVDIRTQLPEDSKRFDLVDVEWKELMKEAVQKPLAIDACNVEGRQRVLEDMKSLLEQCEKALADYLETKRVAYPRFYFVSSADLIDILSKGSNPLLIQKHLSKCFDNIQKLEFAVDKEGRTTHMAVGMHSKEKEYVAFPKPFACEGPVEVWLNGLTDAMRDALRVRLQEGAASYDEKPRERWVFDHCAQLVVVVSRIMYTQEVTYAFAAFEDGNEGALREYNRKQQSQLNNLSDIIMQDLSDNDRRKLITLVTIDVHNRDVVTKLVQDKAENAECFQWLSQLRYSIDENTKLCKIDICDFGFTYQYEYIGNCGCLVITPLTDRCYITLTQAQRLGLGGAPAGPAGTGKTETTKDLGRALGMMVYVFNCSDQMDYKTMGAIYKGLAQTGAWGCFDEFNRIPVEVLSVCSTQYRSILDAIRAKKQRFIFEDEEIRLQPTACAFITMNPGYAGRTELPESLKALFRPVSMIVPDMDLITEIMLLGEGFQQGKLLARKFMILYRLCQDLLSSQIHYDWKLRAIKTTLNVAGGLKRADKTLGEERVLLRALRDFNLGKIVADDVPIFMGLLEDLFPKTLELVPRQRDTAFEEAIRDVCVEHNLQPDANFVLKVTQLREIFVVRWSVFLLGPPGCGKSEVWRTLARAQNKVGEKTIYSTLNPKAVTRHELYGYVSAATREWHDGLISQIFRDFANTSGIPHEWIVLDGDIDAEWIESMNTVMDDNKMLTLASNERIPLTAPMRLLFEVADMKNASPATVSRGGVVFLNASDVGFAPIYMSWLHTRPEMERIALEKMFDKHAEAMVTYVHKNYKSIIPINEVAMVTAWCSLLQGLLDSDAFSRVGSGASMSTSVRHAPIGSKSIRRNVDERMLEPLFIFSAIWALGGGLTRDKVHDQRADFSRFVRDEFKSPKLPDEGLVFDYYVDFEQQTLLPWADKVPAYLHTPDTAFSSIFVPTADTVRLTYLLDLLEERGRAAMFVGPAGTGKTMIVREKLKSLDPELTLAVTINFNCMTDSLSLQTIMEQPLEKKAGRAYGPPGQKKLVYFIDDMNMPAVDKYGTQQPIALLRQHTDYHQWYDRAKLQLKEIVNTQYMACMNPTAGSFTIDPRLQRQFATFAVQMPSQEDLQSIYGQILHGHLQRFDTAVSGLAERMVSASLDLHRNVAETFVPTAVKFHYQFNLRELSAIFQGLCLSAPEGYATPLAMVRLWVHECERTFQDRLVSDADISRCGELVVEIVRKYFEELNVEQVFARPLLFTSFVTPSGDESLNYIACADYAKLRRVLEERLSEYNETRPVMKLVLFDQAMEHICRICRILQNPRGNALLVGVGGSGKQSLARLAAFICGYDVFQIAVTQTYGVAEFRAELQNLYMRTGVKGLKLVFLLTDGQIVDERFMVYLNDVLSSGYIPDLFSADERDNIVNAVRSEVKQEGIQDTRDNCWDFFVEKVRKNLHVVLCVSPVGDKFRVRARQFPGMITCSTIDWFHEWTTEALVAVAGRFLKEVEHISGEQREAIAQHCAFVHHSVNIASAAFFEQERRHNYTTPKSYLELIALYKSMLARKRGEIQSLKARLENGLEKLRDTESKVADLQEQLKEEMVVVEEKKGSALKLLEQLGQETAVAEEQKAIAAVKEAKSSEIAAEVAAFQKECSDDLAVAEPIIQEAERALNSLDKKSLTELKAFTSPADDIINVGKAVLVLCAPGGRIPKDLSWNNFKKLMASVEKFLVGLQTFDKDNVPEACVAFVEKNILAVPGFEPESIKVKSLAASGLCKWCINICKYFRIYQKVQPKRDKLAEANKKLEDANAILQKDRDKVATLEAKLAKLTATFEHATEEKNAAMAVAEKTQQRADIAQRLVNGLSDEKVRWTQTIEQFSKIESTLVGDMLLAAAFVSYIGAFSARYRSQLVFERWIPDLVEHQIPLTEGITPMAKLTDEAEIARWANEGLPSDQLSVENGAIVCNCSRWPLMIDPQLQGIRWIREREEKNGLRILQQGQPKYVDAIEQCIQNGTPVLIENLGESIDAVLEPVLSRALIKRGRATVVRIGDREVEWDANFRLFLHTKLSNPHYRPEIAAQCTLINFTVTEQGLEEQLLAMVVNKERPDLEHQRAELLHQQNDFKIKIKELEDNLLFRLSNAQGDILSDVDLINNLEENKRTAKEIADKVVLAKETEVQINAAREAYRPVAVRGSLAYFLVDSLCVLDHMYQFSMAWFVYLMRKGMDKAPAAKALDERVEALIDAVLYTVYAAVAAGLFERHKITFAVQLCLLVLVKGNEVEPDLLSFLLRGPSAPADENPCAEWMTDVGWSGIQVLKEHEAFESLAADIEGSAKRWREWSEVERPEHEPMPGDWKKLPDFHRLLIVKCIRPDRMVEAMGGFVKGYLGERFVNSQPPTLEEAFEDARPDRPVFFILSPGVDPVKDVELLGRKLGYTQDSGKLVLVSLGQGQEPVAERALEKAHAHGGWVILQNIHLTPRWTSGFLERRLDKIAAGAHENFRLFLSAEPTPLNDMPVSILQGCVKLTNEPPDGLRMNVSRALATFTDEMFENSNKQGEYKAITFALCLFHAIVVERKKFGAMGWNGLYPFNVGDLTSSAMVTNNYLEVGGPGAKIPWEDLRYIFGEIMYGGHITDDWDRRLCNAYLTTLMRDELIDGTELWPGFTTPKSWGHPFRSFIRHVEERMPPETPVAFGLHPNAEIGFRLAQGETLFKEILELQPRGGAGPAAGGMSVQEKAKQALDDILDKMPEAFNLHEIAANIEERTPYVNVFLQEIERMIALRAEVVRSLQELDLGLKGDLTISEPMEQLMRALFDDKVPGSWERYAYPSLRPLASWLVNLLERYKQYQEWTQDPGLPKVTWLSGLFNPQSFLTAVMQTTARKNEWALDRTLIQTEVTRKQPDDIDMPAREGAYITGLILEGARWDDSKGSLDDSRPKELYARMPVIHVKAVPADSAEQRDSYVCPVYKTQRRGPTYVFAAGLKTRHPQTKWILAGVALLMDAVK
eukprot:tig00000042_g15496.t1